MYVQPIQQCRGLDGFLPGVPTAPLAILGERPEMPDAEAVAAAVVVVAVVVAAAVEASVMIMLRCNCGDCC